MPIPLFEFLQRVEDHVVRYSSDVKIIRTWGLIPTADQSAMIGYHSSHDFLVEEHDLVLDVHLVDVVGGVLMRE